MAENGDASGSSGHARRGIKFDPTINLGHIGTMGASLLMIGMAWANLDTRVVQGAKVADDLKLEVRQLGVNKADKETVDKGGAELSRRITEQQGLFNQTQLRTAEDVREIKILLRELDAKIDRKVDKPGR